MADGFKRGRSYTNWDTGNLLDKMRVEKPACRVCGNPCDPDVAPCTILFVALDVLSYEVGMIPMHCDTHGPGGRHCESEGRDMLQRAQARVEARRLLNGLADGASS